MLGHSQAIISLANSLLVVLGLQGLLLNLLFPNPLLGHIKLLLSLCQLLGRGLLLSSQFSRTLPGHRSFISLLLGSLHHRVRAHRSLRISRLRLRSLLWRLLPVALLLIIAFLARRRRAGLLLISLLLGISGLLGIGLLLRRISGLLLLLIGLLLLISLQLLLIGLLLGISLRVYLLGLLIWALLVSSLLLDLRAAPLLGAQSPFLARSRGALLATGDSLAAPTWSLISLDLRNLISLGLRSLIGRGPLVRVIFGGIVIYV